MFKPPPTNVAIHSVEDGGERQTLESPDAPENKHTKRKRRSLGVGKSAKKVKTDVTTKTHKTKAVTLKGKAKQVRSNIGEGKRACKSKTKSYVEATYQVGQQSLTRHLLAVKTRTRTRLCSVTKRSRCA